MSFDLSARFKVDQGDTTRTFVFALFKFQRAERVQGSQYLSGASIQAARVTDVPYDLITFLTMIQKLQIDILPIAWQVARQQIAVGETGKIRQAQIDLQTSFAFKCVADRQKEDGRGERQVERKTISALINEIIVLGHTSIREHPNIVDLQGICWGIMPDDKVWPVLVFRKTQYGDLYNFAALPIGRELSIGQRLKLCVDVGTAISDMYCNSKLSLGRQL